MRVAIPELFGKVNPHFGQSTNFSIIDLNNSEIVGMKTISAHGLQHKYDQTAQLLQANQVDVVLAGKINKKCFNTLKNYGFLVISGVDGDIISAAIAYAQGELINYEYNCSRKERCRPA
ncbi:NifB/NifX family molybdenum-iron cluster-binding protein [Thermincola ferriacetica]